MKDQQDEIAQAIRMSGEVALKPLYHELKGPFESIMRRYTSNTEMILDAFHEAMIAFYEYCINGKYDARKGSIKGLIYQMGRAYLINRLKKEGREINYETNRISAHILNQMRSQSESSLPARTQELQLAMMRLGEKCRKLLVLFFYNNFSIEVIKERMNYKNENVVSSHKSRCIKQLAQILQKKA